MPKYIVILNGISYKHCSFPIAENIKHKDYLVFECFDLGASTTFPIDKIASLVVLSEGE